MTTSKNSSFRDMEEVISKKYRGVLPSDLRTIPLSQAPSPNCTAQDIYGDILTDRGLAEWQEAESKFKQGKFRNTFMSWYVYPMKSGSWIKNPKYDTHVGLQGILNTYWNRQVIGRFADVVYPSEQAETCTSVVEYIGYGWCSTISGSIYALPPDKCSSDDYPATLSYMHNLP